jgi:redox-sensing transcriptional repressor
LPGGAGLLIIVKVLTFTRRGDLSDRRDLPEASRRRISRYMRCLGMALSGGRRWVTSAYLAGRCMKSPASVRKDLAALGYLGKRGAGYDAAELLASLQRVMGLSPPPALAMVGAGRLGRALLESGIPGGPYRFTAAFDTDGRKAGSKVGGVRVEPPENMGRHFAGGPEGIIAVVAVEQGRLQEAVRLLGEAGCRWALSFTLEPVEVPGGMTLRYMEIATELDLLARMMKREAGD